MTRRRRWGLKKGENNLTSNQFPKCGNSVRLRELITGLIGLSPFDFPSSPNHLYRPPPSSPLHVTLCTSLVSLAVENCFTINLDVLSSVQFGWRSLEATVRIRLKARGRRHNSKT